MERTYVRDCGVRKDRSPSLRFGLGLQPLERFLGGLRMLGLDGFGDLLDRDFGFGAHAGIIEQGQSQFQGARAGRRRRGRRESAGGRRRCGCPPATGDSARPVWRRDGRSPRREANQAAQGQPAQRFTARLAINARPRHPRPRDRANPPAREPRRRECARRNPPWRLCSAASAGHRRRRATAPARRCGSRRLAPTQRRAHGCGAAGGCRSAAIACAAALSASERTRRRGRW